MWYQFGISYVHTRVQHDDVVRSCISYPPCWSLSKSSPSQGGHQHHHQCWCCISYLRQCQATLCRLLAKCLTQQVAQYASHVAPFAPHCVQKPFVFTCQSLSFMSAHVLCVISHCTAMCSTEIQLPGMFPCSRREEMLFLSLPVVTSPFMSK